MALEQINMAEWLLNDRQDLTVLAQMATVSQLPGFVRKRLHVPPTLQAVVVNIDGNAVTRLLPGGHTLGGMWQWYTGATSKMAYTLLPNEPFPLLAAAQLLTGDDQLVELQCAFSLQIGQADRFYARFLAGKGQVTMLDLQTAVSGWLQDILKLTLSDYAAADLNISPVPDSLAHVIRQQASSLAAWGLILHTISKPTAMSVEALTTLAEKQVALAARLRQLEQESQLSRLSEEAELRAYIRQLEADYDLPGLADLLIETATTPDNGTESYIPTLAPQQQLQQLANQLAPSRLAGQLARLRQRQPDNETTTRTTMVPTEPAWLRLMMPVRHLFSLVTLFLLFYSFTAVDRQSPGYQREQLELLLSAGMLLLGIAYSLWQETRTRSQLLNQQVMGSLSLLSQHDRQVADRLLRQQVQQELSGLQNKLHEARLVLYKTGHKRSIASMGDLENLAARLLRELPQADVARAPYLTNTAVSPSEVAAMLNYDENLLRHLNQVHDETQALISVLYQDEKVLPGEKIAALAAALSEFEHRFQARTRFIRMPSAD